LDPGNEEALQRLLGTAKLFSYPRKHEKKESPKRVKDQLIANNIK